MSAPVASETRSLSRASSEIRAFPGRGAEPGGDQERADFVALEAGGMGFVVQPRAADVHCRGMIEQFFFDGVPVEPGDGAAAG
jgi:hypothetical protein